MQIGMPTLKTTEGEKRTKPFKEFRFLWNTLRVFGIDIESNKTGKVTLVATKIVPLLLHVTQLLISGSLLVSMFGKHVDTVIVIPYLTVSFLSTALWHIIYRRRTRIRNVLEQVYRLRELKSPVNKYEKVFMNLILFIALIYPSTCAFICFWGLPVAPRPYQEFYSLSINVQNAEITVFVRFMLTQTGLIIHYTLPGLVTVTCSFLYYELSNLVKGLATIVDGYQERSPSPETLRRRLQSYRAVFNTAEEIEDVLSIVTFLLLCSQVTVMFVTLAALFVQKMFQSVLWQCMPAVTSVPLFVIGELVCASRVSSSVERLRTSLKKFRDKLVSDGRVNDLELLLIDTMKDDIFPKMTAMGVVELKSNLIPAVFGSLFTYGVLIVSVGSNDTGE